MSTRVAKECFQENLNLFANPNQDPEKYNLYTGLLALLEAVEHIEQQNDTIQRQIRLLASGRQ